MADDWADEAACKGMDPNLFHPYRGDSVHPKAEAACLRCPVQAQCWTHALEHEPVGYWAGTTPDDRMAIRQRDGVHINPRSILAPRERWVS